MAKSDDDDEVSEVTESSWFKRLGQSMAGILVGSVLIIGACVLLFWNEGRAVKTARSAGAAVLVCSCVLNVWKSTDSSPSPTVPSWPSTRA